MIDYSEYSNDEKGIVDEEDMTMSIEEVELLDMPNDEDDDEETGKPLEAVIGFATTDVYLRKGPDKSFDYLTVIKKDEELLIDLTDYYMDWYNVCTSTGVEGYVMKKFVEIR